MLGTCLQYIYMYIYQVLAIMLQHPLPIKFNSDCNKPFAGFDMVVVMSQPTCNHGSRQTVRQNIWTGMLAIPCTCAKGGFLFFFFISWLCHGSDPLCGWLHESRKRQRHQASTFQKLLLAGIEFLGNPQLPLPFRK